MYTESIRFIHSDGNEYTFKTEPNPLSGSQMWWFEPQKGMNAGTVQQAKQIASRIKEKADVIEVKSGSAYGETILKN